MRLLMLLAVAAPLSCTGCFQMKAEYVIAKDGSGSASLHTVVDRHTWKVIEKFYEANFGGGAAEGGAQEMPAKALFDSWAKADEIKKRIEGKRGVELIHAEQTEDVEQNTLTVESCVRFDRLEDFYRSGVEPHTEVELASGKDGTWTLTRTILPPDDGLDERRAKKVRDTVKNYSPILRKFFEKATIDIDLITPTIVLATTGVRSEDAAAVHWHFATADIAVATPPTTTITIVGAGLHWRPFHLRIDLNGRVTDLLAEPTAATPNRPGGAPKAPDQPPESTPAK
jgi:hypothetical protein